VQILPPLILNSAAASAPTSIFMVTMTMATMAVMTTMIGMTHRDDHRDEGYAARLHPGTAAARAPAACTHPTDHGRGTHPL
jgi:hypothetical protein